jgi:hypothetical protein
MAAMVSSTAVATAQQSGTAAPGACTLLTTELVMEHSPASKEALKEMMKVPPREDKIDATGSACHHGDIVLQINPFPMANFDPMFGRWTPVPNLGDKAYFRDNKGRWAELALVAGGRMITVQIDVPAGKKAESIQSNNVALAKAVLAQLK